MTKKNIGITPKGAYWDKFNSEEFVTWAKPADSNVVWYDKKNIGITRYRKTVFIRGRVISLVGVWAYHWGHCMYQFLPKLFSAGEAGLLDDSITILVVENEDATIMEIIKSYLTNYPNAKIKFITKKIDYTCEYCISCLHRVQALMVLNSGLTIHIIFPVMYWIRQRNILSIQL